MKERTPQEEIAALQEAIRRDPEDAEAHFLLGYLYSEMDRFEEARAATGQALALDRSYMEAYYRVILMYMDRGHYEEMIELIQQALHLEPERMELYVLLGTAYAQTQRWAEADDAYHAAIRCQPNAAAPHAARAALYWRQGERDKAWAEYRIVKGLDQKEAANLRELLERNPDSM